MTYPQRILVANRGEVAVRVLRTAAALQIPTVAVYSEDDAQCLHVRRADAAVALSGSGASAYLDIRQIIAAAVESGCDAVHPGWGFLSESAAFAQECADAGLVFIGPAPEVLAQLGDKVRAREVAARADVPVARGTTTATSRDEVAAFLETSPHGIMIKAVGGGGGRGMRVVQDPADVPEAYERCRSEAMASFGSDDLYVEELLRGYRHIELQVVGDAHGTVRCIGDRDCSVQRRHQKLIEIAPASNLAAATREALFSAAEAFGSALGYQGVGTIEFLVGPDGKFVFMEANPRLQVEHTVTEEVLGIDLVATQIGLSAGLPLDELDVRRSEPQGVAIQMRVNTESMRADGSTAPSTGRLTAFDPPSGRGVRVDTHGYSGYTVGARFDSLLAKVVVHAADASMATAVRMATRALQEFRVEGVEVNTGFLEQLLARDEVREGTADTSFVDDHVAELVHASGAPRQQLWFDSPRQGDASTPSTQTVVTAPGTTPVAAPMDGTVVQVPIGAGDVVAGGAVVMVIEAMKMEHQVLAPAAGTVDAVLVDVGATVRGGDVVAAFRVDDSAETDELAPDEVDLDLVRADLQLVLDRQAQVLDAARPGAVEKRRARGRRTARENLEELCAPRGFSEYGSLALAAQRGRRSLEDLITRAPADGLVSAIGHVNSETFDDEHSRCVVMSYDYTVMAGTQGYQGHRKKDRLFEIAERLRLPVVVFAEGGGGRPGDSQNPGIANLDCRAFALFSRLSGLVPTVGVVTGHCFAGNAALLAVCDVIIATPEANIGMAGPAMIEGGGLGTFRPDEVGPVSVQAPNGVIDLVVADDAEAVQMTQKYLSYFQGSLEEWTEHDQRLLRHAVPENRRRTYDVRTVIEYLADVDSVLELRRDFGAAILTALIRIEGRPVGLIANNPSHLGGAIDADGADKASRFMELCDAFDIPLVSLCDTPGFMVGPTAEETAQVRHFGRMFVAGASLTVPLVTVVLRKGYGLGAQAMAAGGFFEPALTLSWPTGEFGGMGLEGAVQLGYRRELDAVEDPVERQALYEQLVAEMYERGSAVNVATVFEIDDVIDPADTRRRIVGVLAALPTPPPRTTKKRPLVPTW